MGKRNRTDPLDLDMLASDIADMLDKYEYPISDTIGDDEIRAALPAFLKAMGLGLNGQPLGEHTGGPVADSPADAAFVQAMTTGQPDPDLVLHEVGDACTLGLWHYGECVKNTKHTCNPNRPGYPLPYGRKADPGKCPRCDELRAGAKPRPAPEWIERYRAIRHVDAARAEEIRRHFAPGSPHERGACGPVCTAFDW